MAIENPQTPCGHHQQPRARKKDANQLNREFALGSVKPGRDDVDQQRRREHAEQNQNGTDQAENRGNGSCDFLRKCLFTACQQIGVDRDEGRRKHPFSK